MVQDNVRRGCRLQDRGTVGGVVADYMSSFTITVGERRGSLGVGFENMRSSRVMKWSHQGLGVVAFRWLVDGNAKAQGRGKGSGAVACHHR